MISSSVGGLDDLHEAPEVALASAEVAEPATAGPLFEDHLHRGVVGVRIHLGELFKRAAEDVAGGGLDFDFLGDVEGELFEVHGECSVMVGVGGGRVEILRRCYVYYL